jgi:hypothetical protein
MRRRVRQLARRPSGVALRDPETDAGGAAACRGTLRLTACDEWPWIATEEGGPKPEGALEPSAPLRIINARQNSGSDSKYRWFIAKCQMKTRKAVPIPQNGAGKFLVVPYPKTAPALTPSQYLCNGSNPTAP